jgi:hypothetical protein
MKNFRKSLLAQTNDLKSSTEKNIWGPKLKKNLKNRLSIRIRNFEPPNEPLNIFKNFFYFNPEVAHT